MLVLHTDGRSMPDDLDLKVIMGLQGSDLSWTEAHLIGELVSTNMPESPLTRIATPPSPSTLS